MNGIADSFTSAARPTPQQILELYAERDSTSREEQRLEETIFNGEVKTEAEAAELVEKYRALKIKRMELSLKAAFGFMLLPPGDKMTVSSSWAQTRAAREKAEGSGIRGIPHIKMGVF